MATPIEIRQRLNEEVERIRGYADLTEEAKQRRIAEARERFQAEYQETIEAEERAVQERTEKAEKVLFQASDPYGASEVELGGPRKGSWSRREARKGSRSGPLLPHHPIPLPGGG